MSRIGNKPITVPSDVTVKIEESKVTVTGPKGTLEKEFDKNISIELDGNVIKVTRSNDEKQNRSCVFNSKPRRTKSTPSACN